MERYYRDYSSWLMEKYGERVYKLPINLTQANCPNRDGRIGYGGCDFCDATGSGFHLLPDALSIKEQVAENKAFYQRRFSCQKFIAYFQSFSNTYVPLDVFKEAMYEGTADPDIVGLSLSTRPDLLHPAYLEVLQELAEERHLDIDIELGLQTVNYHTLEDMNRGHGLAEFIDAVLRAHACGFRVCAHVILNLPGDDHLDVEETARVLSALKVDFVKLHSLYIVGGTPLAKRYVKGEFQMISLEEYVDRAVDFLELLDPDMVISRLVGKGPQEKLIFCNWDTSWWRIKDAINDSFARRGSHQGSRFSYLKGALMEDMLKGGHEA